MPLGPTIRALLSPAMERRLSGLYRSVFVDLDKVASSLLPHLVKDARILDVGGGDGELLNRLLDVRPDLSIDMVDIAPVVGKFVQSEHEIHVRKFPNMPLEDLSADLTGYDVGLISDVMHHLPSDYRASFLQAIRARLAPNACILIKDIEPGHAIASLSLFCDMYISGDKGVSLVSIADLTALCRSLNPTNMVEIGLLQQDKPNYALKVTLRQDTGMS